MRKRSMGFLKYGLFLLLIGITAIACKQSAIFYAISLEEEPVPPMIDGMPTKMVKYGTSLCVASRFGKTLYWYDNTWGTRSPGGNILDLAATSIATSILCVLTGSPGSVDIQVWNGSTWTPLGFKKDIQSIYGANNHVFASVGNSSAFEIWSGQENSGNITLTLLKSNTKFLTGAVYDSSSSKYYLATAGDGIYTYDGSTISSVPVDGSTGLNITGIIMVGATVVAVSRDGYVLYYDTTDSKFKWQSNGVIFTGGLATYEKGSTKLLLLGIHGTGTSTSHGYREIVLDSNGDLDPANMALQVPGENKANSSVDNTDKYKSTIGRRPVMAFLQADDMTLFAATVKDGLWSYRDGWRAEK